MLASSLATLGAVILLAGSSPERGSGFEIDWISTTGGSVIGAQGSFELSATAGEPVSGHPTGGAFDLVLGFWAIATIDAQPPCVCGDINGSGGPVDLNDFATFANCFNLSATVPGCLCADVDGNGLINLGDFATFALLFNTNSTNSPPNCP